jgi:hypothetical protein
MDEAGFNADVIEAALADNIKMKFLKHIIAIRTWSKV